MGDEILDLIDHLDGVADPVVPPEFPLRAEGTGEGAAAGHVRYRNAHAERHIDVLRPFKQRPVGVDRVKVLYRGGRLGRHDLAPVDEGQPLDCVAGGGPLAGVDRAYQLAKNFFALAAHDNVDPGRLREHLLVHKGGVNPAEHTDGMRGYLIGDFQNLLGLIDGGRYGGGADDIRFECDQPVPEFGIRQIVGHGVYERDVAKSHILEVAG